jgi:2-amino-4-hydroxy-6-hydroxymethyldihydropteridine diphosphokinase
VGTDPAERTTVYVGIGSNLADPLAQVQEALGELAALPLTELAACSALYRTAPVGPQDQPDYVNAAARLETGLAPDALLAALQGVERSHGRVRDGTRWGPRTLDLDILLYGAERIDRPGLRVPHPEMHRRAFVLVPLADVAPLDLSVPGMGTLGELLAACPAAGVLPIAPPPGCGPAGAVSESDPLTSPQPAD